MPEKLSTGIFLSCFEICVLIRDFPKGVNILAGVRNVYSI